MTTLKEWYAADDRRARSPEADYGVWWRQGGANYRVSYVARTGEVYAVSMDDLDVEVLAVVPPDEPEFDGGTYYMTVDRLLEGWAEECGKPDSLNWIRERLAGYRVAA